MMTRVAILLFPDVEELDLVGPYQVFGAAHAAKPEAFEVFLVASDASAPVRCVNGLRVLADHDFRSAPAIDLLLIPGGVGTRRVAKDVLSIEWIRRTAKSARLVASVCTGARVTLAAGLADDKRITTHWSAIEELRADGRAAAVLDNSRYVADGNIVHAAGVSAGIDMALWLLARSKIRYLRAISRKSSNIFLSRHTRIDRFGRELFLSRRACRCRR